MTSVSVSGEKQRKGLVYLATNLVNGKVYVGITTRQLSARIGEHIYDSFTENGHSPTYFHKAMAKYGIENFKFTVLEEVERTSFDDMREQLYALEQKYISEYQSNNKNVGYNLTDGGDGITGYRMTLEQRQKIGDIHRGKKLSDEHKARIKAFMNSDKNPNIGRKCSEETKIKISEAKKGKYNGTQNPMYGKSRLDVAERNKASAIKICQYDLTTGELIKVWSSSREIQRETGYNRSCIIDCCTHKTKQSHGYRWEYYSD